MTSTSGHQRVPSVYFSTSRLAVPSPDIARRFNALNASLMSKIKANTTQSLTLATLARHAAAEAAERGVEH